MPIKFRCSYCRQFLGISRNRVGSVVDCPTCGRSIRVPGLDGVAAPLPAPELDREDAHLARALDELAALAEAPLHRPAIATDEEFNEEAEIPQPLPEPEPVELPMPIRIEPVTLPEPAAAPILEEADARAAIEALMRSAPVVEVAPPVSPVLSPQLITWAAVIHALTLLVGIAVGWALGHRPPPPQPMPHPVVAAAEPAGPVGTTELEGRVIYRTTDGEVRPDVGAIVIAVPETWTGTLRLSPIGLRPGDAEADQTAALVMASAFGGGAAKTDDAGRYRFPIANAGRYRVVIISRFSERAESETLSDDVRDELTTFLADPAATVGRRAVHLTPISLAADKSTAFDHSF